MHVVLWGLLGLVLGAGAVILIAGVIVPAIWTISQREGAYAMGVIFVMAPAGGVLGLILGLIYGWYR